MNKMILFIAGFIETLLLTVFTMNVVDNKPYSAALIQMLCFFVWCLAVKYISTEPNNWGVITLYVLGAGAGTLVAFKIIKLLKK